MKIIVFVFAALLSNAAFSQQNFGDKVDPVATIRDNKPPTLNAKPDYEAELREVARQTGVPVDVARDFPDETKRQNAVGTISVDALAKTSPTTAALIADVETTKIANDNANNYSGLLAVLIVVIVISALALAGYFLFGPIKRLSARVFSSQTARRFVVLHAAWTIGLVFFSMALPSVMDRFDLGFNGDRETNHTLALSFITPWLALAFWKAWRWATNSALKGTSQ